jgi:2-oxoglutarate ferredoxin oxidoreductase subunit beta
MHTTPDDWALELPERYFTLEDYEGGVARWCPGCGDHGILAAVQRICRDQQIPSERIVAISGIGCASRFPHYMHAYGFHGLHGRALPVACGVKARRPDLDVWVATGDGDCCSIGAGHWLHAIRFNMDITVMLFDNNIYGLTKKQTSPTTPQGTLTNTSPEGAWLPPLNVLETVLGFTNVSFAARTIDWNAAHLYDTLRRAHAHRGLSFVHILQRCPTYSAQLFDGWRNDPEKVVLLEHESGVEIADSVGRIFTNREPHDPSDLQAARKWTTDERLALGLLYCNPDAPRYDTFTSRGLEVPAEQRAAAVTRELERFVI